MKNLSCFTVLIALFGAVLLAGCGQRDVPTELVKARNLKTGVIQEFSSADDVPVGFVLCADPSCEVPDTIACDELGQDVCLLHPGCYLETLDCAVPAGEAGNSSSGDQIDPADYPPDCSPFCVPKPSLQCEGFTDETACQAHPECEWGLFICPLCPAMEGYPCDCLPSCGPRLAPVCQDLDETACQQRPDCTVLGACPACATSDGQPCACETVCMPATPDSCPEIAPAPVPCDDGRLVPILDPMGCVTGFECLKTPDCPPVPTISCVDGQPSYTYDEQGCIIDLECPNAGNTCRATGCSGQICADIDLESTCEWQEHYQCYKLATCGRQADGKCGWLENEPFIKCMEQFNPQP